MPIIEKEIPSQILRAFPGHAKKIMWPTLWGTITHTYRDTHIHMWKRRWKI